MAETTQDREKRLRAVAHGTFGVGREGLASALRDAGAVPASDEKLDEYLEKTRDTRSLERQRVINMGAAGAVNRAAAMKKGGFGELVPGSGRFVGTTTLDLLAAKRNERKAAWAKHQAEAAKRWEGREAREKVMRDAYGEFNKRTDRAASMFGIRTMTQSPLEQAKAEIVQAGRGGPMSNQKAALNKLADFEFGRELEAGRHRQGLEKLKQEGDQLLEQTKVKGLADIAKATIEQGGKDPDLDDAVRSIFGASQAAKAGVVNRGQRAESLMEKASDAGKSEWHEAIAAMEAEASAPFLSYADLQRAKLRGLESKAPAAFTKFLGSQAYKKRMRDIGTIG